MNGTVDHDEDVKETGEAAAAADGAEETSVRKKLKTTTRKAKAFNLDHIRAVGENTINFKDFSHQMAYTGRGEFALSLALGIKELILLDLEVLDSGMLYLERGTAFVYSTVPGVGKTRSMLELRNTLSRQLEKSYETSATWETGEEITIDDVRFGYSGFNSQLHLSDYEIGMITNEESAQRVLFRRIVGSVLVETPSSTSLPLFGALYEECDFPSVDILKTMLKSQLRREDRRKVTLVIVGVDEVQLLNKSKTLHGEGLGRLFLRYIRQWQTELINFNILLVAVGTGVTLDFSVDGSTGQNSPLAGDADAVLITKEDFRALAVAKYTSKEADFDLRYGKGAKETICDKVAVLWWPRVRLIQKWQPKVFRKPQVQMDSNTKCWLECLTRWILDKPLHTWEKEYLPGGNENIGVIGAVFEIGRYIQEYKVIPDFANIEALVDALVRSTPGTAVKSLYSYLSHMSSLDPSDQVFNSTSSEKYGFHVIGASLHLGIHVLSVDEKGISAYSSPVHAKRLGLAKWVHSKLPGFAATNVCVLGTGVARKSAFYPFTDRWQKTLLSEVKGALECQDKSYNAVFIHTGDQAKCDYLFLFRLGFGEKWIALVADGKFTDVDTGTVSASDQIELIEAAICLKAGLGDQLLDHRALFFTNRDKETAAGSEAYMEAVHRYQTAFDGRSVDLEKIDEETFEFSPFSNVLFMRRNRNEGR